VAEASKGIENAQRDVNISFVNELALIFDRMDIDTGDVLEAAGSKFNFLRYKPGLVGGHCISVDPYYLTHKAVELGYHPDVILSGRRVNNSIPSFIVSKVVKLMITKDIPIRGATVLILGVTFKENCPDIRNTRVVDIYRELSDYGMNVDVCDPWADKQELSDHYNIELLSDDFLKFASGEMSQKNRKRYKAVILATAHTEFTELNLDRITDDICVIFDTKGILDRNKVDARL